KYGHKNPDRSIVYFCFLLIHKFKIYLKTNLKDRNEMEWRNLHSNSEISPLRYASFEMTERTENCN
ncbi:hypothetical protein, partial [Flavobacterium sp. AG291]|uniref:hypothetical protein n=1 Tax=Flavobacterium sp. AG291 TaxID=2184000 RepID=UPI001F36D787